MARLPMGCFQCAQEGTPGLRLPVHAVWDDGANDLSLWCDEHWRGISRWLGQALQVVDRAEAHQLLVSKRGTLNNGDTDDFAVPYRPQEG